MNKINFKNNKGLNIVSNLYCIDSDTIIIMAHGFTNNKSSNGRFDSMAVALNNNGYDALAIDFSGCGESDDADITSENQIDDLNSAIDYAISLNYKNIALLGNSFGTLVCLRCTREEVKTMVLIGALTDSMYYNWNVYFSKKQMNSLEKDGFFYLNTDREHKITKQTLIDFEEINQNKLLEQIQCPILIFHGNSSEDEEELKLLEQSKKAISIIPAYTKLEIIEGGKHGLQKQWNQIVDHTCKWFNTYL